MNRRVTVGILRGGQRCEQIDARRSTALFVVGLAVCAPVYVSPPFCACERVCVRERQRQSFALREGRPLTSTEAFASGLRPAGGEASGLQPSGIDSPMLPIISSVSVSLPPLPPPHSLSPAIPSLPPSLPPSFWPPTPSA